MNHKEEELKRLFIAAGEKLAELNLVCAGSGNLSMRLDEKTVLITATGSELGGLKPGDIVKTDLSGRPCGKAKKLPSSELPIHLMIYNKFPVAAITHCHPPLTNAYFSVMPELKALTFESRFYLKDVPVIRQRGVNVTDPALVIKALKKSNLVVLRNHGVFSIGESFSRDLNPVLILEEAVKVCALARIFKKGSLDRVDREIKKYLL